MDVNGIIASYDRALADVGEDIKLRRTVGTVNAQPIICEGIRAAVTGPGDKSLLGVLAQNEFFCIFSPTRINEKQWPGGQVPMAEGDDVRLPSKVLGDQAFIRGKWRDVEFATGKYPGGTLVRIEMKAVG